MTDRIKVKCKETGKVTSVYPVDAKEYLATGRYSLVDAEKGISGKANWLNEVRKKEHQVEKMIERISEAAEDGEDIPDISSMNAKKLGEFVEEQCLEIDGFDKLNLPKKRKAVLDALLSEVDEDDI